MPLGSTAKKVQKMANLAEKLYERVTELRKEVNATKETVEDTNRRVETLEEELAAQRALVEAVADEEGIDVDAVREGAEREAASGDADAE